MTRNATTPQGRAGVLDRPPIAEDGGPPGRAAAASIPAAGRAPADGRERTAGGDRPAGADDLLAPADRQRLSRELHDRVAHAIVVGLNSLELSEFYAADDRAERARDKWADAVRLLHQALHTTKELATRLRTPGAELQRALSHPRPAPPGSVDVGEIYLILREAVGNALAHAGAEDITISLRTREGAMVAEVADDGSGLQRGERDRSAGLGLTSMKERAALLGGSLRTSPGPHGGTRITLTVPLAAR
ncbi:ATP-binding protein [Streptomyces sp. NPDC000151]|uniref:sensor histidine kinase n=1 Tax=Streptomyces sp. NPDC000151 TaxID=3154244 RepID=UPI0033235A29